MSHLAVEPVPVTIIKSPEELTELSVEYGALSTWSIPQVGTVPEPVQILQRRPSRLETRVILVAAGGATSVVLGHRKDYVASANNPQGGIFPATMFPYTLVWKSQQPLYAAAIGGGPATIITVDYAQAAPGSGAEETYEYTEGDEEEEGQGGLGPSYS